MTEPTTDTRPTRRPAARRKAANGDGGIYQRKLGSGSTVYDVVWSYRDPLGAPKRGIRRGFATKAEAAAFRRDVTQAVDTGRFAAPNRTPLGDYLTSWLEGARLKPQTAAGYERKIRLHIRPHLGHLALGDVKPAHLDALYRRLETQGSPGGTGPLAPATVREIHNIPSAAFRAAIRQGPLTVSPTPRATPPTLKQVKASRPAMTTWTPEQLRAFLTSVRGTRLESLWWVLASTGMRRGEALALHWADIDLERATLTVRYSAGEVRRRDRQPDGTARSYRELLCGSTKTGAVSTLSLDPATIAMLRAHRERQADERAALGDLWTDQDLVFCRGVRRYGAQGPAGGLLDPEHVSGLFRQAVKRAQLPSIRLHDLRHGWATMALQADIHPKIVQEQLGHTTIAITMDTYTHVRPGLAVAAAQRVAALFT